MNEKYPHFYFMIAGIATVGILVLANVFETPKNRYLTIVSIVLFGTAVVLWIMAIFHFKRLGSVAEGGHYYESETLVQEGIFAYLRHPQYLAYILLVIGFALLHRHVIIIGLAGLAVLCFYLYSRAEDRELEQRFHQDYQQYMDRVPAFNFVGGWWLRKKRMKKRS